MTDSISLWEKFPFVGRGICTIYPVVQKSDFEINLLPATLLSILLILKSKNRAGAAQQRPAGSLYQECSATAARTRFPTGSQQDDVEQGGWVAFRHQVDLRRLHQEVRW